MVILDFSIPSHFKHTRLPPGVETISIEASNKDTSYRLLQSCALQMVGKIIKIFYQKETINDSYSGGGLWQFNNIYLHLKNLK